MADVGSVEGRIGRIVDQVSDGILVVDAGWRLLYVNQQAADLVQRPPEQLVGRGLWDEFPAAVDTVFYEAYQRAMTTQEPETVEAYYGPLRGWFEVRIFPAPEGLTLYFRNITDHRVREEERKRLVSRLTAALQRSEQLRELSDALGRAMTVDEVAGLVAHHAQTALGCLFAGVALTDDDRARMRYVSMAPLPHDVARKWSEFPLEASLPATDTVRRSEPLLYADRSEICLDYPHVATDLEAAGTQGMANLPLIASGRTIGALMVTWAEAHKHDDEELRFLQTLAGQAAQAIERARLFSRQRSVASTLQRAILPRELPTIDGVELAARYAPAEVGVDVGGDWYDAFRLVDGRIALTIGDVAGHGLDAAALMGQLRNAARAYAVDTPDPGALVTKLNRLLFETSHALLATTVFAVLDPAADVLQWANAGHPPPVVIDSEGTARFLEHVHGPPLGTDAGLSFETSRCPVDGDTLLLYTDGLIEQRRRSIGEGLASLLRVAGSACLTDVERCCDDIAAGTLAQREREDDMCVLVARHLGE